uniref:ARAD1C23474p n=1 Tax=Blastobotrys adeninivorans TaxID=409370 RepID=A0A060T288_BLAAD
MDLINIANTLVLDPRYHDILAVLKGARNGAVYGARLRFCHALVMSVLFRSGSVKQRWDGIIKNTRQHAKALASFVTIYKTVLLVLKYSRQYMGQFQPPTLTQIKSHSNAMDAFWGGLIGGYIVFGRNSPNAALSSINQQIVLYVFSRVILGMCNKLLHSTVHTKHQRHKVANVSWAVMSSVSWALIMYLFRLDASVLQKSMLHSMNYMYIDSEKWSSVFDFI